MAVRESIIPSSDRSGSELSQTVDHVKGGLQLGQSCEQFSGRIVIWSSTDTDSYTLT